MKMKNVLAMLCAVAVTLSTVTTPIMAAGMTEQSEMGRGMTETELLETELLETEELETEELETETLETEIVKTKVSETEKAKTEADPVADKIVQSDGMIETKVGTSLPEGSPKLEQMRNIAKGKDVISSLKTYNVGGSGDHSESKLVDGNLKEFVQVDGDKVSGKNDWELTVDLGEDISPWSAVVFRKLNLGGNNNNVTKYTVRISDDGKEWQTLGEMVQEEQATYDDMYFVPAESQSARYVQLFIPDAGNWATVAELEVYLQEEAGEDTNIDTNGFPNMALTSKISISEPTYNGHPVSHVADENIATYVQADNGQPFDLVFRLSERTTVDTAIMRRWESKQEHRITKFRISGSLDGEEWTEAAVREVKPSEMKDDIAVRFAPIEAEYIKFEMLEYQEWMAIVELELYDLTKVPTVRSSIASGSTLAKGDKISLLPYKDAQIYYTEDGSDPLTSETAKLYEEPIEIQDDVIIKAYAKLEGYRDSKVVEFRYAMRYIDTDPKPGVVEEGTSVTLLNHMPDSTIYYTTDGSDPTLSKTKQEYQEPIPVGSYLELNAYCKGISTTKDSPAYRFVYGVKNIVKGMEITTSSAKGGNEGTKATDDNADTYWQANENKSGEWIQIDFGTYHDFNNVKIDWLEEDGSYKYLLETSSDGFSWYTYFSSTEASQGGRNHNIPKMENHRRYLRIKILDAGSGKNYGIREIQVIGKESDPVPVVPKYDEAATDNYDRVVVNPIPTKVKGVSEPCISLNGVWNFNMFPQNGFWRDTTDLSEWGQARIPGDLDAEGYAVFDPDNPGWTGSYGEAKFLPGNNLEMAYKTQVFVPEDYAGNKVFMRVDKAYSFSRVWVNGHYVREHRGAFNAWDADITDYIIPGEKNWITVSVTAEGGNGFNFVELRSIRGILSDIVMYATPKNYLNRLQVETDLDDTFKDAKLTVMTNAFLEEEKTGKVNLSLKDGNGNTVNLETDSIVIDKNFSDFNVEIPISNPKKWDSEHPNLYELTAELVVDDQVVETLKKQVGFREITIEGTVFKVNGIATKLRGVNYHTVYGQDGIAYDLEAEKMLLEKLKQSNVNYIRAAHYPLSDKTLDLCDQLGIFVEQENSVCFAGGGGLKGPINNDVRWREYLLHIVSEMVEKDRSHPSIVIWSIANESEWGSNHQKVAEYIKAVCPSIPTKFSWGYNVPDNAPIDIHSNHYKMDGVGRGGRPTVWDEYAHSYSSGSEDMMRFDPGFRENYYDVINQNWEEIYQDSRNLGGAIWDYTDNTFEGKNRVLGNSNWGQIDVWGRDKPEIWATKNVYSPVRYRGGDTAAYPGKNGVLKLPYENRYETVNFGDDDMEILYKVNNGTSAKLTYDLAPKTKGELVVPTPERGWKIGDQITVEFAKTTEGIKRNVVTNVVTLGQPQYLFAPLNGVAPNIAEDEETITLTGNEYVLVFSKETGKITNGTWQDKSVLVGGPHLNLGMNKVGAWTKDAISVEEKDDVAVVTIQGKYGTMGCTFVVTVDAAGRIDTAYQLANDNRMDTYEVGVAYDVPERVESISWVRDGYQSNYPENQLGRLAGTAIKELEWKREYGVKPTMEWKDDDKDFYQYGVDDAGGRGTTDFRASKANIHYAQMNYKGSNEVLSILGNGSGSVRACINKDNSVRMNINNAWGYPVHGLSGIWQKTVPVTPNYRNKVSMSLGDTSDNYYTYCSTPDDTLIITSEGNITKLTGNSLKFSANKKVNWKVENFGVSSDTKATPLAEIDENGLLIALEKKGKVVVTAETKEGTGEKAVFMLELDIDEIADKKVLKKELEAAAEAEKEFTVENTTKSSWGFYQEALTEAKVVYENSKSEQNVVDEAAKKLKDAVAGLEKRAELAQVYELQALAKICAKMEQQYPQNVYASMKLLLSQLQELLGRDAADVTQIEQQEAYQSLEEAQKELLAYKPVNTTVLEDVIKTAKKLDGSRYTAESYARVSSALKAAEQTDLTDQNAINGSIKALLDAIGSLEEKKEENKIEYADITALNNVLSQAAKLERSKYTAGSLRALDSTVTVAKSLAASRPQMTLQIVVNSCEKSVNDAIKALVRVVPAKNTTHKIGDLMYIVTKSASKNGTVAIKKPAKNSLITVKVPDTVSINGYTFKVTSINKNAFKGNKKLKTVSVGKYVESIEKAAFYKCKSLSKIKIGKGLKTIGEKAFYGNGKLTSITIKSSRLDKASSQCFKGIGKRAVIDVPNNKVNKYKNLLKSKGQANSVKIK